MVTDKQVKLLRQRRMEGKTQEAAAAAADMSSRTARRWKAGHVPSQTKKERTWRTRDDPFEEVWDTAVVPLLVSDTEGKLQAVSVLGELQRRYPGRFRNGQVRTLQRRIRDWRAVAGPPQAVFFKQEHPPGREGAFDFTHCTALGVTIAGVAFAHLLFVFRLSFSRWTWVELAFSETYEALVSGVQGALWALDGCPEVARHDNLSAATHELKRGGGRALNKRFADVLAHYGLGSTRINPGESHENGVVEKANDLVKSALRQALLLRGSGDFVSNDAYMAFVREVVERTFNVPAAEQLAVERPHLRALPSTRVPNYTEHTPTVRRWSTIRVAGRAYSVPSRLIGHEVTVRQHPDVLEVFYKGQLVETMVRLRGECEAHIDYRHVIWSLVRKPGAFARYRHREDLFPTLTFRRAYDALKGWHGERTDIEYVRVLHLAASTLESSVEQALTSLLSTGERFDYAALKGLLQPRPSTVPDIHIPEPDLAAYDRLLRGAR